MKISLLKKYWLVVSVWGFLAVVSGGLLFIQARHLLSYQHITCHVGTDSCPDYVQAELQKDLGASIFSQAVERRALKISTLVPSLHQFQVALRWPQTADVIFTPAQNMYVLYHPNSEYLVVDESGTVVATAPQAQLPVVELPDQVYEQLHLRSRLDDHLHQDLVIVLRSLEYHHLEFTALSLVSSEQLRVLLKNGPMVDLLPDQAESELEKLSFLLHSADLSKIKQPIKSIDLRFKYPVLKT